MPRKSTSYVTFFRLFLVDPYFVHNEGLKNRFSILTPYGDFEKNATLKTFLVLSLQN